MKSFKTYLLIIILSFSLFALSGCKKDKVSTIKIGAPLAYYPMDGNAIDMIFSNNGILHGPTPSSNRHGNANSALYFDGIDDYISIPHTERLNFGYNEDFTISLWIEPHENQLDLNGESNAIIYKWNDQGTTQYPYCIRYFNETEIDYTEYTISCARYDFSRNVSEVLSNSNARNNGWNHIVFVKEGANLYIYQNNILANTSVDNSIASTKNNLDITIGCRLPNSTPSGRYFRGKIDDIKFYNKALDSSEVDLLYNE